MAINDQVRKALELRELKLPAGLQVVRVDAEDYTDWEGDDALRINVTVPDSSGIEEAKGEDIIALKSAIHQRLLDRGIKLFPYVFIYKESERAADAKQG